MGNALGGSWRGVLAAASVAALVFVVIVGLAVTGRLGDLKYWSFPGHPYPPTGYYINPFNSGDKGDLVNSADAARVKADLLSDGGIELQAVAANDPSLLNQSTTGGALTALGQLIATNSAAGVTEREGLHLDLVTVGRLSDPNSPDVNWCVEETGSGSITRVSQASGATLSTQTVRFKNRFWLVRSGSRYLITDVLINSKAG